MSGDSGRPAAACPVMVILGQADAVLIAGLDAVGMSPVAEDGEAVIWARPPETPRASACELLLTIADAALALGVSRCVAYELIGRGELAVVRGRGCSRVPVDGVVRLLERRGGGGVTEGGVAR